MIVKMIGVINSSIRFEDSIRSKTNRTTDSIRDSIRTKKNDSQVPNAHASFLYRHCF